MINKAATDYLEGAMTKVIAAVNELAHRVQTLKCHAEAEAAYGHGSAGPVVMGGSAELGDSDHGIYRGNGPNCYAH